jgi:hypothetical protein
LVVACAGPVANGSPIDTSTPGLHTFTVTAATAIGKTSLTHSYTVCRALLLRIVAPCRPPSWTVGTGLWAVSDGSTLLRGGGVTDFLRLGAGRYAVRFRPADVSGCAYLATAASSSAVNGDVATSTYPTSTATSSVYVETRDPSTGVPRDMAFSLVVECGVDKALRFAVVDASGTFVRGSTGSTATGNANGISEITTTRRLDKCGLLATLGDTGTGAAPAFGYVFTATGHQSANGVYVETKNPGGGVSPYPYHQVAYCNNDATASRLFAVVNAAGSLVRGTIGAAARYVGSGLYDVAFQRDVRNCAYVATIGDVSNGLVFNPATINTYPGPISRSVRVRIEDLTFFGGNPGQRPFHLAVAC